MTGFASKRQMAWDKYSTNNKYGTLYWDAFEAGWNAALDQEQEEVAAFIAAEKRKEATRYGYVPKLHPSEWQEQPEQEPVATMKMLHTYGDTAPPKRPWVGLTDDQFLEAARLAEAIRARGNK